MSQIANTENETTTIKTALGRGFRMRCPRCGKGRIFESFLRERRACESCGLHFEDSSGKTWAFMYATTAAFVGPIAFAMLVLQFMGVPLPPVPVIGAIIVLLVLSLPVRKSCAIALDFLIEERDRAGRDTSDAP